MRNSKLSIGFLALLATALVSANSQAQRTVLSQSTIEVLNTFQAIAKIRRGSGHEGAIRNYIQSLFQELNVRLWQGRATWQTDVAGNAMIRLPGTGEYAADTAALALQSHLDMVEATATGSVDSAFESGVKLALTKGWIHSEGQSTTIGVKGIGVAMMLQYLKNPGLVHPPLELIFTVDEERGLVGAMNMGLKPLAKALINLDSEKEGVVSTSSQGEFRVSAEVKWDAAISHTKKLYQMSFRGLRGGHSGTEIGLGCNAAKVFAEFARILQQADSSLRFSTVTIGSLGSHTSIARGFDAQFTCDGLYENLMHSAMKAVLNRLEGCMKGEDQPQLSIQAKLLSERDFHRVMTPEQMKTLLTLIGSTQDGILSYQPRASANEPLLLQTSSNLGYLIVQPEGKDQLKLQVGRMPRSFSKLELEAVRTETLAQWKALLGDGAEISSTPPTPIWIQPATPWLTSHIASQYPTLKLAPITAGLEAAAILRQMPGEAEAISIGPQIEGAHTVNERVNQASIGRLNLLLQQIVKSVGIQLRTCGVKLI